jgi:DNA invertase Pin-like site-specific DNA recombinase
LVVSKLDRLSRSLLDFATPMEQARREKGQVVALDLAIDTTPPSGQLVANVMAAFAECELQSIGARTGPALQQKKLQGVGLGRPRTLSHEITMAVVASREAGKTPQSIADGLNEQGTSTACGGAKWYAATVSQVLRPAELDQHARAVR